MKHIADPKALPRQRNASFLLADEAHDISITGEGTIDCNGEKFVRRKTDPKWTGWEYERSVPPTESLPRVIFLTGCSNVVVRGITIAHPPSGWSTWFHDCDNVLGRPDAIVRATFENCEFKIVSDTELPDFHHHGAADWGRMPGRSSVHCEVTTK